MDFINIDNKEKYVDALEKVVLNNKSETLIELLELLKKYDIKLSKPQSFTTEEESEMLTVDETSELLGVSKPAVYKWIRTGKIQYVEPPVENGKGYLIPKQQFEERLKNQLTKKPRMTMKKMQEIQKKHFGDIELVNPMDIYHNGENGEE